MKSCSLYPSQLNKLYSFAATLYYYPFYKKSDIWGENYLFFKLDLPDISIKPPMSHHVLVDQHVSMYQYQIANNSYFSQYHYTALFEDRWGGVKVAHVYFDANDDVLEVNFSIKYRSGFLKTEKISQESETFFAELAKDACSPLISSVRQLRKEFLDDFVYRFEFLENELSDLSLDLEKNKEAYIKKLEHILPCLETLAEMHDKNYRWIFKYFNQLYEEMVHPKTNSPDKKKMQSQKNSPLRIQNFFSILDDKHVDKIEDSPRLMRGIN